MKIRKKFNVESAHIVRNCSSDRCSHSIHGHSAIIEVLFSTKTFLNEEPNEIRDILDNGQMIMDFGLMKGSIKNFIDTMDHTYLLATGESKEYKKFIKENCERWIELPFNPTAEMLSCWILHEIDKILIATQFNNGESQFSADSVRYHETATGYAEADENDANLFHKFILNKNSEHKLSSAIYSEKIKEELGEDMCKILGAITSEQYLTDIIKNPVIKHQINL